jgi:hypothetical protein
MATTSRFPGGAGKDNTSRIVTNDYQTPAYAATLAVTTTKANTLVKVAQLTGAMTVNVGVGTSTTAPFVGDTLAFIFSADTSARTVTLGTGLAGSASTVVVAISKKATINFVFDGAAWVEVSRAVGA